MEFGKIVIKNDYEKKGDLVLRSYIRALKKIGATTFLDGDNGYVYGIIADGVFYELLTGKPINYNIFEPVTDMDRERLMKCSEQEAAMTRLVTEKVIFNAIDDIGFEISSMEDLANDRTIEYNANNKGLSAIDPYSVFEGLLNGYNSFSHKCKKIIKRK